MPDVQPLSGDIVPLIRIDVAILLKAESFKSDEEARDFVRTILACGMTDVEDAIETFVILSTDRRDGR